MMMLIISLELLQKLLIKITMRQLKLFLYVGLLMRIREKKILLVLDVRN